ncbi:hypothetical protein ACH42_17180 [Endozoicomonas sp. (ex Bugula neritina AB1)]|nr:hypothetical protein ACH42_17180 [Endozoicomonas sp. (ex Bugula neritina AB1)]
MKTARQQWLESLTWTCHICGEERPDNKISVHTNDVSAQYALPEHSMKNNIRYCNDNPACKEAAKTYRFIRK